MLLCVNVVFVCVLLIVKMLLCECDVCLCIVNIKKECFHACEYVCVIFVRLINTKYIHTQNQPIGANACVSERNTIMKTVCMDFVSPPGMQGIRRTWESLARIPVVRRLECMLFDACECVCVCVCVCLCTHTLHAIVVVDSDLVRVEWSVRKSFIS